MGYWIVEQLVNRTVEFYPRGGMVALVSIFLVYHAASPTLDNSTFRFGAWVNYKRLGSPSSLTITHPLE